MSKNGLHEMTDAEWEAKFNGPRDRLFKKIFGDSTSTKTSSGDKTAAATVADHS